MAGPAALTVVYFAGRWTVAYCMPPAVVCAGFGFVPSVRELFSANGTPLAVDFKYISVLTGAAADIQHKIKTAMPQNGVARRLLCPHPSLLQFTPNAV